MTEIQPFDWQSVSFGEARSRLLLGRRDRDGLLNVRQVDLTDAVAQELRLLADVAHDRLINSTSVTYSETRLLEDDEFMVGSVADILATKPGGVTPETEADVQIDEMASLLVAIGDAPHSVDRVSRDELNTFSPTFYIVLQQDDVGGSLAFVKRVRGLRVGRAGRILLRYADALAKLDDPVFALSYDFDFVLHGDDAAIWRLDDFVALFADVNLLQANAPQFVRAFTSSMPLKLSEASIALLKEHGASGPRAAQQVRRISRAEHLSQISDQRMSAVLHELAEANHQISATAAGLEIPAESVQLFLFIVEQRVWKGSFDGVIRQAQAFASVRTA